MCPRLAPRSSLTFHRLLRPHAPPLERGPLAPGSAPVDAEDGPPASRTRSKTHTKEKKIMRKNKEVLLCVKTIGNL